MHNACEKWHQYRARKESSARKFNDIEHNALPPFHLPRHDRDSIIMSKVLGCSAEVLVTRQKEALSSSARTRVSMVRMENRGDYRAA